MINKFDIFTLGCKYMRFGHTPFEQGSSCFEIPRETHSICLKYENFQSYTADIMLTTNAKKFRITNHPLRLQNKCKNVRGVFKSP